MRWTDRAGGRRHCLRGRGGGRLSPRRGNQHPAQGKNFRHISARARVALTFPPFARFNSSHAPCRCSAPERRDPGTHRLNIHIITPQGTARKTWAEHAHRQEGSRFAACTTLSLHTACSCARMIPCRCLESFLPRIKHKCQDSLLEHSTRALPLECLACRFWPCHSLSGAN